MTWTWHALHTCVSRANPTVHNSCFYTNAWGYFEDVKPLWCGFREGVKPANCIHHSYESAVNDNRHWRARSGYRDWGASWCLPAVWAWLAVCCVLLPCLNTPSIHKKPSQRIIPLFSRSRSGVQILISPGCRSSCCRQQLHSSLCH